jgi:hypothetical protein
MVAFAAIAHAQTPTPSPAPGVVAVPSASPGPSLPAGSSPTPVASPTTPPTATPPPTPPPIVLLPEGGTVAVGSTQVIAVSSVMGTIAAVVHDPTIVDAAIDQDARTITLTGKAPGTTDITVSDSRGLTKELPVRVAFNAGDIAPFATIQLTGDPASNDFVRLQVANLAASLARPRDGAQVVATADDVPFDGNLGQDDVADIDVPVLIQGQQYFSVEGKTRVRVENVAAPRIAPDFLMVSDSPERLTENGLLFEADLRNDTPSRFLYFHYNPPGQPDRRVVLRAQNNSDEPATLQFISGSGGPSPNEMSAGHDSTKLFLVRLLQNEGRLLVVPARSSLNIVAHDLPAGTTSSNMLQLRVLNGAAVHLTLFAQDATSDPQESLASTELLGSAVKHARGIYNLPEFHLFTQWSVNAPYLQLAIGQIPVPNTIQGEALAGDYGILQSFVVNVQNPNPRPQAIAIYENPRGGRATGTYIIDGVLVQSHQVPAFSRYKVRQYVVPAKGFVRVTIDTMAEGGSSYPLDLIFAPDDGSVPPGAPGSPIY